MKFRKKPVEVEAVRWTGKNTREVRAWITEQERGRMLAEKVAVFVPRRSAAMTETLWKNIADPEWSDEVTAAIYDYLHETYVGVKDGHWIICGVKGEFYPCDDSTFHDTYERVQEAPDGSTTYIEETA